LLFDGRLIKIHNPDGDFFAINNLLDQPQILLRAAVNQLIIRHSADECPGYFLRVQVTSKTYQPAII
jgi:hypothetical protein